MSVRITKREFKTISKNAVLLQTHWQCVPSVVRIVLNSVFDSLVRAQGQLGSKSALLTYYGKRKGCLKSRGFNILSQKKILYIQAQKKLGARCTCVGNLKAILENNPFLASHRIKPNSVRKTPCFGKITNQMVFLVIWTKVSFQCTDLQRLKIELIKKGYSWITERTKFVWKCFFSQTHIGRLF